MLFDKQGRINLPNTLIKHASLNKACFVIGVSDRIEIWSEERWTSFAEEANESFEDIAEEMIDFGL